MAAFIKNTTSRYRIMHKSNKTAKSYSIPMGSIFLKRFNKINIIFKAENKIPIVSNASYLI